MKIRYAYVMTGARIKKGSKLMGSKKADSVREKGGGGMPREGKSARLSSEGT